MSYGDTEPSELHGGEAPGVCLLAPASRVTFDRRELNRIFGLYGRKVAAGEWRDYAIDFLKDRAVFSVFRRACEIPIYRIEKNPKLARRQGVKPEALQGIPSNVIVRSLGPEPLVQVDIEGPHAIEPGDVYVLCSDGLSGPVSDREIGAVVSALSPKEACRFLIDLANLQGGPDNITVIVARVLGDGEPRIGAHGKSQRVEGMINAAHRR